MYEWTLYNGFEIVPTVTVVGSLPNSLLQWPTPSSATLSKKRPHQRMNTLPELSQNHVNFLYHPGIPYPSFVLLLFVCSLSTTELNVQLTC